MRVNLRNYLVIHVQAALRLCQPPPHSSDSCGNGHPLSCFHGSLHLLHSQLNTLSGLEREKQDPCWEERTRWYFIYADFYKHYAGFCSLRCRQETIMLVSTLWDYTAKILQNAINSQYYFLIASLLQLIYNRHSLLYSYFFIETIALNWSSLWNILSKIRERNHAWAPKALTHSLWERIETTNIIISIKTFEGRMPEKCF